MIRGDRAIRYLCVGRFVAQPIAGLLHRQEKKFSESIFHLSVSGGIGWLAGILDLNNVAPSIGLRTVEIGKAIELGELATRERLAAPALNVPICSKVGNRAADVTRRFGDDEMRLFGDRVTPICLADTVVVQHLLGPKPAGSQRNCAAPIRPEFVGLRPSDATGGGLSEIIEQ